MMDLPSELWGEIAARCDLRILRPLRLVSRAARAGVNGRVKRMSLSHHQLRRPDIAFARACSLIGAMPALSAVFLSFPLTFDTRAVIEGAMYTLSGRPGKWNCVARVVRLKAGTQWFLDSTELLAYIHRHHYTIRSVDLALTQPIKATG